MLCGAKGERLIASTANGMMLTVLSRVNHCHSSASTAELRHLDACHNIPGEGEQKIMSCTQDLCTHCHSSPWTTAMRRLYAQATIVCKHKIISCTQELCTQGRSLS